MNRHRHFLLVVVGIASLCAAGLGVGSEQAAAEPGAALAASGNGRVAVLIAFRNIPGPSERALVRGQGGAIKYSYRLVPGIAASLPEKAVAALLANPSVRRIDPDGEIHAIDAELDASWGVKRIGAGTIHAGLNKGAGVKVAIIDTGIDYNHSDLAANYKGGYDFFNDDADPLDDHSHGTHVAGIVAARDDEAGVVGVAPEADLYALKILSASGSGNNSDMIAAMEWAIDNSMDVVNLSLGTPTDPGPLVQAVFDEAEAAGIIIVAAAGNSDFFGWIGNTVQWPARYESVIAVGATNSADSLAYYSSTGPQVELAAPGDAVTSTVLSGAYGTKSGTSMASPHVAGTAALVIAAGYSDVRARLATTADDLGLPGPDTWYGYGLVDADEAAAPLAGPPPAPTADFTATPTSGNAPLTVQFTDESLGTVDDWSWDFGDGETSTAQNPSHTYADEGTYTVTLTVSNAGGSNTQTKTDYITVTTPPPPPVADFIGAPLSGDAPLMVSFTDLSTGTITEWSWDFGDDGSSTLQNPSHEYTSAGSYTVTLTVTGPGGTDEVTKTNYVVVEEPSPEPSPTTMHVSAIDMWADRVRKMNLVYTTVTVEDDLDDPVAGAMVFVTTVLPNGKSVSQSGTTDSNGAVTFSVKSTRTGTYTSTVTDITGPLTYEPEENVETIKEHFVP